MDGGFYAVHHPTGTVVASAARYHLRLAELSTGLVTGRWLEFPVRIRAQAGGFYAPPRPERIGQRHTVDPMGWWTPRPYPVDDHLVGVDRA